MAPARRRIPRPSPPARPSPPRPRRRCRCPPARGRRRRPPPRRSRREVLGAGRQRPHLLRNDRRGRGPCSPARAASIGRVDRRDVRLRRDLAMVRGDPRHPPASYPDRVHAISMRRRTFSEVLRQDRASRLRRSCASPVERDTSGDRIRRLGQRFRGLPQLGQLGHRPVAHTARSRRRPGRSRRRCDAHSPAPGPVMPPRGDEALAEEQDGPAPSLPPGSVRSRRARGRPAAAGQPVHRARDAPTGRAMRKTRTYQMRRSRRARHAADEGDVAGCRESAPASASVASVVRCTTARPEREGDGSRLRVEPFVVQRAKSRRRRREAARMRSRQLRQPPRHVARAAERDGGISGPTGARSRRRAPG
jgi:hypothetical protein